MITRNAVDIQTFDDAVEAFRTRALPAFLAGDPATNVEHFSHQDDATLANPLGPPVRGWAAVSNAVAIAAAQVADGSMRGIEEVSPVGTPDLGYVVEIEQAQARLGGSGEVSRISLRVTMTFRREEDGWKVVRRHTDPITSARPGPTRDGGRS